ncbi:MAG: cytochrome c-type biogenesis protein [Pseudomonadota bacterium]
MSRYWWLSVIALALVTTSASVFAIDTDRAFDDDKMQARYQRLIAEVRCITCQNQTIKDSNAPLANDLRAVIREQMKAGATDREIYAFLQQRYGDFALYKPPLSAKTALLWFSPLILMVIGGVAFYRTVAARGKFDVSVDGE